MPRPKRQGTGKRDKYPADHHYCQRKGQGYAHSDFVGNAAKQEHGESNAAGDSAIYPAGMDIIQSHIFGTEFPQDGQYAEINQTFEHIGNIDSPQSPRRF